MQLKFSIEAIYQNRKYHIPRIMKCITLQCTFEKSFFKTAEDRPTFDHQAEWDRKPINLFKLMSALNFKRW